ncbi:MAG: hypothetical protein FRX49_02999 [Trebouxia sp. A1-2]|nr:MAG: hypothetical protein FRX49_02999 [Trebouxia sp. A1-2]
MASSNSQQQQQQQQRSTTTVLTGTTQQDPSATVGAHILGLIHSGGALADATLNKQTLHVRYQKGIQVMLSQWFNKKPFEEDKYIVREGKMAGQYS